MRGWSKSTVYVILSPLKGAKITLLSPSETLIALFITRNFLGQADFKIKVVYPSVDFDTSYDPVKLEAFRKKLGLQDEKIVITLGRLNKRKGQDLVIEAIAQLKKEYNLKYFIIGRGLEKKNLELLIDQHKLSKQVFIFDNIDDEDLIYFFKLAHYFVMPFRDGDQDIEGFGTVFLEAALCNLPIISGNSGGIKEMFNDPSQAILIPSDDLRVLIKAMKFLLKNKSYSNINILFFDCGWTEEEHLRFLSDYTRDNILIAKIKRYKYLHRFLKAQKKRSW